jgi:hypothetical protein
MGARAPGGEHEHDAERHGAQACPLMPDAAQARLADGQREHLKKHKNRTLQDHQTACASPRSRSCGCGRPIRIAPGTLAQGA